ncbi:MAG: zinc-binding dehydrogenase [Candidatus Wallbacteria bacterium]|nr:zinc-binding dehydrogenase [Candidatus Wallbacteria bacterium]
MPTGRAIFITRHGGPEVLQEREFPVPEPGPGRVLIECAAAGVNFADVFERLGLYDQAPSPPFVPGFEASGVVLRTGEGVTGLAPGDRVVAVTRFGGYVSLLDAPAAHCLRMPAAASFEEGAALAAVSMTAYHGLFTLGRVRDGMRVLVHAAAGGVGLAMLQLLKTRAVEVFATAGSPAKLEVARAHGAHVAVDYRAVDFEAAIKEATGGRGVDLIFDSVGGEVFRKSYRLLAPMGHLVAFGAASMMPAGPRPNWLELAWRYLTRPRLDILEMLHENRTVSTFNTVQLFLHEEVLGHSLREVERLWHSGILAPVVGRVFPFELAGEAQEALRSRATVGKVVLSLAGPPSPRVPCAGGGAGRDRCASGHDGHPVVVQAGRNLAFVARLAAGPSISREGGQPTGIPKGPSRLLDHRVEVTHRPGVEVGRGAGGPIGQELDLLLGAEFDGGQLPGRGNSGLAPQNSHPEAAGEAHHDAGGVPELDAAT